MNTVKKVTISLILALIFVFGISTSAIAKSQGSFDKSNIGQYNVGDTMQINETIFYRDQLYCVEHHQKLPTQLTTYKLISKVHIVGDKSTDYQGKEITNKNNAILVGILNGTDKGNREPMRNAIWNFMYQWVSQVGKQHAGIYDGFASNVKGDYTTQLEKDANQYANSISGKNWEVKDTTDKTKLKIKTEEINQKQYIKLGPFSMEFAGKLTSLIAKDQDNKAISNMLVGTYEGKEIKWKKVSEIKSGDKFYIAIPADAKISKITNLTAKIKISLKKADIWFFKCAVGADQNFIYFEPGSENKEVETAFDYDIPMQGDLKVIKVNKDNQEVKLKGVGFYIQQKNTGKYVHQDANGTISYVKKDKATEFVTDDKGEILIKNLLIGTYVAYETKNPNYGYEIITDGVEQEVVVDKTKDLIISNKQIYVKLSGYVWVDKYDGKTSERNNLYKTSSDSLPDTKDILFNGITVRLKDRTTGETVKETVTSKLDRYKDSVNDGNGEYLFMDVLIEKLKDYYIEFEYDGLTYTNVIPNIDKDRGSKSAESEKEREDFNKNFSVVEGKTRETGFTRDASGNEKHTLSYHISETGHEATLINNGQYKITANTDVPNYVINDHFTYGQEEIQYINLGLYEREQPDIALVKDLQNVKLTINGYEHTYVYAQRFLNAGEYGDGFNVGVKFGSKYGSMSYSRAIYKADYEYSNGNDKSKELKVYVTYRITMRNQSSNLTAQVNSLADYYDSKYEITKVGTGLNEREEIVGDITHTDTTYNEKYKKTIINNNTKIGAQKEESIYVQFALSREAVINILNDKENLNNVTEINSYSIYEGDKIYAGIDIDSNPGNCVPGDTKTYEDDTDSSPALKLEVADGREMTGKVFLDSTSGDLKTGKVRQGSGIYEDGEQGIEGVDITLTENTGSGKVYTAKTDANGDFFLSGYIPGDYTLTYTWGDKTYTVQDYKGTVYNSTRNQNDKNWYKEKVDIRYTDAIDNYATNQEAPKGSRKQIDAEMTTSAEIANVTRTKMDSTTPTMGIGVEYETTYTASAGDKYTYRISNIDFGIVERARQVLDISKKVAAVKITLANGQTLVDAKVVNGKLEGEAIKGLTYMGPSNGSNGFVKAEIDNELIQGATIQIEYAIKVENNSEMDYDSENYYKYGIIEGNIIQVKPEGVYDYLDSQMVLDETKDNGEWKVISRSDYDNTISSPTMIETYFNDGKTIVTKEDGTQVETYRWEVSNSSYQEVFTEWATSVTEGKTIRNAKLENKTILHNAKLEKELKPGESNSVNLYTSKVLANTDEIDLNNDTEMTDIRRVQQAGRMPNVFISQTYDRGETVTVTTPTGENQNYILPITIGVTALIILGAGVVIIKKKVI